jgi:hypothetical protein
VPVAGLEPFDPGQVAGLLWQTGARLRPVRLRARSLHRLGGRRDVVEGPPAGRRFAVATLLATQYALATVTRAKDQADDKTQSLRCDCFAGCFTAAVLLGSRSKTSSYQSSPGHLDEAITPLPVFRGPLGVGKARRWVRAGSALPQRWDQTCSDLIDSRWSPVRGIAAVGHRFGGSRRLGSGPPGSGCGGESRRHRRRPRCRRAGGATTESVAPTWQEANAGPRRWGGNTFLVTARAAG